MNCKPGDLAIIVSATDPNNLGRIVEVLHRAVDGEKRISSIGPVCMKVSPGKIVWLIRCASPLASVNICRKTGLRKHYLDREGWIADIKLRPVSGLPITDEIVNEVTA